MHGSVKIFCVPFDLHDHSLHMSVVGGGGRGWSAMMRRDEDVVVRFLLPSDFFPPNRREDFYCRFLLSSRRIDATNTNQVHPSSSIAHPNSFQQPSTSIISTLIISNRQAIAGHSPYRRLWQWVCQTPTKKCIYYV